MCSACPLRQRVASVWLRGSRWAPVVSDGLVVAGLPQGSPRHAAVHVVAQQGLLVLRPVPLHHDGRLGVPGRKDAARGRRDHCRGDRGSGLGAAAESWVSPQGVAAGDTDEVGMRSQGDGATGLPTLPTSHMTLHKGAAITSPQKDHVRERSAWPGDTRCESHHLSSQDARGMWNGIWKGPEFTHDLTLCSSHLLQGSRGLWPLAFNPWCHQRP